jgi:hypothetical protein
LPLTIPVSLKVTGNQNSMVGKFSHRSPVSPVILGGLLVVIVAGVVFYGTSRLPQTDPQATATATPTQNLVLGAVLSYREGGVQYRNEGGDWRVAEDGLSLKQGDTVRIIGSGRAIVTLDDGSAARLNGDSVLVLEQLLASDIRLRNDSGELYTRVVPMNRQFSVVAGSSTYTSLGTAYKTINTADVKGVEVYQSKVKYSGSGKEVEVGEGLRYLVENASDATKVKTLQSLNVAEMSQNEFILWNKSKDLEAAEFREKLGVLQEVQVTSSPKQTATPTPKVSAIATPKTVSPANGITLSAVKSEKGITLSWKVVGTDVSKGFKVVMSESANPTYPENSAKFVEAKSRSTVWDVKDGKAYNFRVCAYTGDGCSTYSNNVKVTAPLVKKENNSPVSQVSAINLSLAGGASIQWSTQGSAAYGFKVVYSRNTSPVYPPQSDDRSEYYGSGSSQASLTPFEGSGRYYIRVCEYLEGTCGTYSNQVEIDL